MGARTGGRAVALQILFGLDAIGVLEAERRATLDVPETLRRYWASFEDAEAQSEESDPDSRAFADALVTELLARLDDVDRALRKASTNWRLERMPRVDRNVARIGVFELLARADVPRAVAIDEAVELAKRFGGDDSQKFVNGVLERVADEAGRIEARASQGAGAGEGNKRGGKRPRGRG